MRFGLRRRRRAGPGIPDGLWADDFGRIDRACRRFVQVSQGREECAPVLATLEQVRALAWAACVAAAAEGARDGVREVPQDERLAALHRGLSRAAGRCAQAAQAVVLGGPDGGVAAAQRAAGQALAMLEQR